MSVQKIFMLEVGGKGFAQEVMQGYIFMEVISLCDKCWLGVGPVLFYKGSLRRGVKTMVILMPLLTC